MGCKHDWVRSGCGNDLICIKCGYAAMQATMTMPVAELAVARREKQRRACNCDTCDLKDTCQYVYKFQRLPRVSGGLGLCKRLEEVR